MAAASEVIRSRGTGGRAAGIIWYIPGSSMVKERDGVDKKMLQQYSDALVRIKYLRGTIEKLNNKIEKLEHTDYGLVGDTVSKGKRGKKPLGTARVTGFPVPEYEETKYQLKVRKELLCRQEENLLQLTNEVEEYIASICDIEMQNILTLYYIEDMTWVQVAHRMNELYKNKNYTMENCRKKHERLFL